MKSIKIHGGEGLLNEIKSIHYNKSIKLYTLNGELENHISQKIIHQWNPFLTRIDWENAKGIHSIQKNSEGISLSLNGQLIKDSLQLSRANTNLDAALYVFWQPFKLVDPLAKKVFLGKQKILDSIEVFGLKVSYSDDPEADQWFYYFNSINFKIRAVKVNHNKRSSLILNESYETNTGMYLNKTRKSYFLNSLGQINYLRAVYEYEITSLERYKK